jgi:hypothetical protein
VTYPAVAARAEVSRTFPYDNGDARKPVTTAIKGADSRTGPITRHKPRRLGGNGRSTPSKHSGHPRRSSARTAGCGDRQNRAGECSGSRGGCEAPASGSLNRPNQRPGTSSSRTIGGPKAGSSPRWS